MKMSNFSGCYINYDVGLVNDTMDSVPDDFIPIRRMTKFITFQPAVGTVNSVEVLDVSIHGLGRVDGMDYFVFSNPGEEFEGFYRVKARLNYTTLDGFTFNKVHSLKIPIVGLKFAGCEDVCDSVRCGPLPETNVVPLALTGNPTKLLVNVKIYRVADLPYYVNGVKIEDHEFSFSCGFHTEEFDSVGNLFSVDMIYGSNEDRGVVGLEGGFEYNESGEVEGSVSSIEFAKLMSITMSGSVDDGSSSFVIPANGRIDLNFDYIEFTEDGNEKKEGIMGSISLNVGSSLSIPIVSVSGGFVLANESDVEVGLSSSGNYVVYDGSSQSIVQNPSFVIKSGLGLIFKAVEDEEEVNNEYRAVMSGYINNNVSDGGVNNFRSLNVKLYDSAKPNSQLELRYTPSIDDVEAKINTILEANVLVIGLIGTVNNEKIAVSGLGIQFERFRYVNSFGNEEDDGMTSLMFTLQDVEFDIEGNDQHFSIKIDDDMLIKPTDSDMVDMTGFNDGIFIPAGTRFVFNFQNINDNGDGEEEGNGENESVSIYISDLSGLRSFRDMNKGDYRSFPIYWDSRSGGAALNFMDSNKTLTVGIGSSYSIYGDILVGRSIMDFNTDAGFVVPVMENGCYYKKYVRISDLYNIVANYEVGNRSQPPELEDRLHACEVAINNVCSSTLVNGAGEAARLYNIKNKYSSVIVN